LLLRRPPAGLGLGGVLGVGLGVGKASRTVETVNLDAEPGVFSIPLADWVAPTNLLVDVGVEGEGEVAATAPPLVGDSTRRRLGV